jgi:nitroimidazol reductase NimA-like FMN-containing flavoprotein (pyridoxamine 5'-phosphate oxidase superfamily)
MAMIALTPGSPGFAVGLRESGMRRFPTDHAGLEILPFEECLRLLASVSVGRVGFVADGEVVVLPVNHFVDGQDVVFRTAHGSKVSAAEGQNRAAFEADYYNEQTRSGWSVLVNGRAEVVGAEAEIQRLGVSSSRRDIYPWVTAVRHPFWMRIRPVSVSGRQTPGTMWASHIGGTYSQPPDAVD